MKYLIDIYRSTRKEGMYVYVRKGAGLDALPEELQRRFGRGELAMSLVLTREKKLARVDAGAVIDSIEQQGFFLQLPPVPGTDDAYMQQIPNAKMGRS